MLHKTDTCGNPNHSEFKLKRPMFQNHWNVKLNFLHTFGCLIIFHVAMDQAMKVKVPEWILVIFT